MKICCDICGGELIVLEGGKGAVCKICGIEHSIERVREMLGVVAGEKEIVKDTNIENERITKPEFDDTLTESNESDFIIKKGFLSKRLVGYDGTAKRVIFPKNITEVNGDGIFSGHNEIVELVFLGGITTTEGREFSNCKNLKKIICNGAMLIAPETFSGCENLEEVHIICEDTCDDIVQLGDKAFAGCDNLKGFYIDEKCQVELYDDVFKNCKSLKKVVLPRHTVCFGEEEGIKPGTFEDCISLEEVVMPDDLRSIHKNAFKNSTNLKKLTYNDGRNFDGKSVMIHPEAFENSSWTN